MSTTYNYQPGYPVDTSSGGSETHLSAFQKIKLEFERLYRVINSEFSSWSSTLEGWQKAWDAFKTSVNSKLNDMQDEIDDLKTAWDKWKSDFETRWSNYTKSMDTKIDSLSFSPAIDYSSGITALSWDTSVDADMNSNCTAWVSKTYTCPSDGYIYGACSEGSFSVTVNGVGANIGLVSYIVYTHTWSQSAGNTGSSSSGSYSNVHFGFYVKKGDVLNVCPTGGTGSAYTGHGSASVSFWKIR